MSECFLSPLYAVGFIKWWWSYHFSPLLTFHFLKFSLQSTAHGVPGLLGRTAQFPAVEGLSSGHGTSLRWHKMAGHPAPKREWNPNPVKWLHVQGVIQVTTASKFLFKSRLLSHLNFTDIMFDCSTSSQIESTGTVTYGSCDVDTTGGKMYNQWRELSYLDRHKSISMHVNISWMISIDVTPF